jgi:hypothetical protein
MLQLIEYQYYFSLVYYLLKNNIQNHYFLTYFVSINGKENINRF